MGERPLKPGLKSTAVGGAVTASSAREWTPGRSWYRWPTVEPFDPEPSRRGWREHWARWRADADAPTPVPRGEGRIAQVRYGLAQPFLGLRVIARSPELQGLALAPAVGVMLVGVLAGVGVAAQEGLVRGLVAWWLTVAALAPVPSVLFGRLYAHMAARSRPLLGLSAHEPYRRRLLQLIAEAVVQLLVLGLGVLPYTALTGLVPGIGAPLALALQGAWTLHWIVVEGYDNSRTLPPGTTVAQLERLGHDRGGAPWFHRLYEGSPRPLLLAPLLALLGMLSEVVTSLARAWRVEVDLVEDEPWISLGFGLGVVVMLAIPGLNLVFRPAVVVGGVHLRHRLLEGPALPPAVRGQTAPQSVVPPAGR